MPYSYLQLVERIDVVPYRHELDVFSAFRSRVYRLIAHDGKQPLGYLLPCIVTELAQHPDIVVVDDFARTVQLHPGLKTEKERNEALSDLASQWREENVFETLKGWRNELYTIYDNTKKPYMRLERALCPLLGIVMYGCHINGYVKDEETDEIKLWIPRRSATKPTYPGMLDNMVAGGLGYPHGCFDTCVKECYEEAGLEPEYVKKHLKSVGMISYLYQKSMDFDSEDGLIQPEVEYTYDLKLDKTVIPHPVDNEAEDFQLMSIAEVDKRLRNGEFKPNCAGVIIDFFIRHSIVTPESEPDFLTIVGKLHRLLPFPLR
ncbi:unnamed protein product [Ambrosiozyma monospora]|uniref:Unnamed protein product n=1 Tax=Ambrosiozyma monospora TaxID=43982 RepID=A0ACB5TC69_AMBMO|nr:unnamed protein product [Ambrosiozyma monospora]